MDKAKRTATEERRTAPAVDLTDGATPTAPLPDQLDRYVKETLAANAAVVLAKTQASAARAEARDLSSRLRELEDDLADERAVRDEAESRFAASQRQQALLERDRAVAEALADELRRQVEQERLERSLLATRVAELENDRDDAVALLGWLGRQRYNARRSPSDELPGYEPLPPAPLPASVRSR